MSEPQVNVVFVQRKACADKNALAPVRQGDADNVRTSPASEKHRRSTQRSADGAPSRQPLTRCSRFIGRPLTLRLRRKQLLQYHNFSL